MCVSERLSCVSTTPLESILATFSVVSEGLWKQRGGDRRVGAVLLTLKWHDRGGSNRVGTVWDYFEA